MKCDLYYLGEIIPAKAVSANAGISNFKKILPAGPFSFAPLILLLQRRPCIFDIFESRIISFFFIEKNS